MNFNKKLEKCTFRKDMDLVFRYDIKYNLIDFRGKKREWKGRLDVNKKGNFNFIHKRHINFIRPRSIIMKLC